MCVIGQQGSLFCDWFIVWLSTFCMFLIGRQGSVICSWLTNLWLLNPDWLSTRWRFSSVGNILVCNQPVSLAIPTWIGAVSTSRSWHVNRHTAWWWWAMVWQCKLVSGRGLRKGRSAPPYGSGRTLFYVVFTRLFTVCVFVIGWLFHTWLVDYVIVYSLRVCDWSAGLCRRNTTSCYWRIVIPAFIQT